MLHELPVFRIVLWVDQLGLDSAQSTEYAVIDYRIFRRIVHREDSRGDRRKQPRQLRSGIVHPDRRVADREGVDQIYTGEFDTAASHLQRYDVTYVYVGPNERERYGEELRSFDQPAFSVAFENEAVTIYEVDHSALE